VATGASYSSYEMADKKLGDDLFDAFIAMVWGFATRGAGQVSTIVTVKTKSRAELLGGQDNLLLGVIQ